MPRTIGSLGSVALLVSSITGPSLVVIPPLFQQAGWLTPLLTFAAIALLSGAAALFIVEAMSSIEGNESFKAAIEFTTIAHLFLGKRWHVVVQVLLYLAMQTLVIASLLESFQSMDAFLISVAHKTCAVSFTDGWVCVDQIPLNASSAFSGHILGSFGTLITISLVLPLSLVHLVDNVIFQIVSFIILLIITIIWIVIFAVRGLHIGHIPVVGHNQSTVVGFVLSNFSFVTTIPAWVNNIHPSVNIRLVVWMSIFISCLIYIPVGWMGGLAFVLPNNVTLLQVFATDPGRGALSTIGRVSSYVFPLAVLITSIPVFTIVIRYNLLRGNICSYKMAVFWSAILPWLIAIPFQTNGGLATILNWASLIFTSPSNLLVPFILFIISKRHSASAVLDANVSPRFAHGPEIPLPLTPIELTSTPERIATPVDNVPVVVITDSTDAEFDTSDDIKTFVSKPSEEGAKSTLTLDPIPVSIQNRVSSPSKYRYYGREVLSEVDDGSTSASGGGGPDRHVLFLDAAEKTAAETHAHTHDHHHYHQRRRPSLSLSLSRSHSITHMSGPGMDEFLLMSPASTASASASHSHSRAESVRGVLGAHGPRPSMSASTNLGLPEPTTSYSYFAPSASSTPGDGATGPVPGSTSAGAGSHYPRPHVQLSVSTTTAIEEPVRVFKAFPCLAPSSVIQSTRVSVVAFVLASALVLVAIIYNIVQSVGGGSGG